MVSPDPALAHPRIQFSLFSGKAVKGSNAGVVVPFAMNVGSKKTVTLYVEVKTGNVKARLEYYRK